MFQRQPYGSISPFQSWSSGINPFFQYAFGANPFSQFTGGPSPLVQSAGLMNPFQPVGLPEQSFLGAALNPFVSQALGAQVLGVPPVLGMGPTAGFGVNPLASQYVFGGGQINPFIGHPGAIGPAGPLQQINPFIGHPVAIGPAGPLQVDPMTAMLLAHQFNPGAQHLPIRPLAVQNPFEQIQGLAGSPMIGQPHDPYTALISAQILSQQSANPLYQLARGHYGNPYAWGFGQFPSGTPFGIY